MQSKKKYPRWMIADFVKQINQELFGGIISVELLDIKQNSAHKGVMAWCLGDWEIELNHHEIPNTLELFDTLAHELIHIRQNQLDIPANHGGKFFKFYAKKFCTIYGVSYQSFKGY